MIRYTVQILVPFASRRLLVLGVKKYLSIFRTVCQEKLVIDLPIEAGAANETFILRLLVIQENFL